ncbi:MAG: vWA domain-containing protein [Methylovirgula sp.]
MNYAVANPAFLWLLLLAPLPFFVTALRRSAFPSLEPVPRDATSSLVGTLIKSAGAVAIAAGAIALAQPYHVAERIKLVAVGAHVVILMDRSLSMDFTLTDDEVRGKQESKTQMATRLLLDFVNQSPHDQFGVVAFSSAPVFVLPISGHRDAVKAAIYALRRPGIEGTNVGLGLQLALAMIGHDPDAKSPAILLVSDGEYGGAGFFELNLQDNLRKQFRREHAHLYWLFLRAHEGNEDVFSPPPSGEEDSPHTKPERHMDMFFKTLGEPYRVFWADSPHAIQDAVTEINHLETRAVTYFEDIPRRDFTPIFFGIAAFACLLLVLAKCVETELRRSLAFAGRRGSL